MAGARKFSLAHLDRNDLAALTKDAAVVSGLPYIMDVDSTAVKEILGV